jgi:hypothetical protein
VWSKSQGLQGSQSAGGRLPDRSNDCEQFVSIIGSASAEQCDSGSGDAHGGYCALFTGRMAGICGAQKRAMVIRRRTGRVPSDSSRKLRRYSLTKVGFPRLPECNNLNSTVRTAPTSRSCRTPNCNPGGVPNFLFADHTGVFVFTNLLLLLLVFRPLLAEGRNRQVGVEAGLWRISPTW